MKQKTLKGSFSLFGKGLHTGLNLTVTFNPAPENTGYKIKRIDLEGEPVIDAIAENVIDTQRLLEEHHRQLLRDGFFRDKKRFDAEMEGK